MLAEASVAAEISCYVKHGLIECSVSESFQVIVLDSLLVHP